MGTIGHRPDQGKTVSTVEESEKAVLGILLFCPRELPQAIDSGLQPGQFFAPHHEAIYEAMLALHREGQAIDVQTVHARIAAMGKEGRLLMHNGLAYLCALQNEGVSASGLTDHVAAVQSAAIERRQQLLRSELDRPISAQKRRQIGADLAQLQNEHDALQLQAEGWPEPLPLPPGSRLPRLTADMLPPSMRDWLWDVAERMQCPPEYPAVAALCAAASLIGRKLSIYPKRHDDWREVCNLWGLIIGPPGILKTPAMETALEPIQRMEREARAQHERQQADHELGAKVARAQSKGIEAKITAATKDDPSADIDELKEALRKCDSKAPPARRYVVHDCTIEALGPILRDNPRGVLFARDEATGWLRTMDRDGHEGDRAFYLECWSGRSGRSSDRVIRQIGNYGMCLSIVAGIQPGPLSTYIEEAARGGAGDDGFIQRFQLSVWPETSDDFQMVDRQPDRDARERAYQVFRSIDALDPHQLGAQQDGEVCFLRFADDAQERFLSWLTELEHRLRPKGGLHPIMQSHLAKYRGLCPKLALLFHVVECVHQGTSGPVSLAAAELAIRWCRFLEAHAFRLFDRAISPGQAEAIALSERIRSSQLPARFTPRDVYRHGWSSLKTAAAVRAGSERLAELHWLRRSRTSTGGRPADEIVLNPKLRHRLPRATAKADKSSAEALFSTDSPQP